MKSSPFLAHELITKLKLSVEYDVRYSNFIYDISKLEESTKFDLGNIDDTCDMATISKGEFWRLPAPTSLFQVTCEHTVEGNITVLLLAQETTIGTNSGGRIAGSVWSTYRKKSSGWDVTYRQFFLDEESGYIQPCRHPSEDPSPLSEDELLPQNIIGIVSCAIEVFSCSNVFTIEHAPAKFINTKRKAKGKVPLFSYRTLHIRVDEDARKINRWNKTSHESPRLHLRRGHIRRLQGGERIWVRAHLVGDKSKGFTHNDYIVHPAA